MIFLKKTEFEDLRKILDPFAKQILYWCSKYDLSFPRSCDIVSKYILHRIQKLFSITDKYDISVVRGHYVCDIEMTCEDYDEDLPVSPCQGCTCDSVMQHTYLVFVNKQTRERSIIDYTHYQFHDDYRDLEEILLNKTLTQDELFDQLSRYSTFVGIPEKEKYLKTKSVKIEDFSVLGVLEEYFEEANTMI